MNDRMQGRRMSANALLASGEYVSEHRLSHTPGAHRRYGLAKRMASRDSKHVTTSATSSPASRRFNLNASTSGTQPNVTTQHSADDCLEKIKPFIDNRKSRSSSTSTILNRIDGDVKPFQSGVAYRKSPAKHLPATNFIKKSDYKIRSIVKTVEIIDHRSDENDVHQKDEGEKIETNDRGTVGRQVSIDESTVHRSRKPILRKSKRLVRTDSEMFEEGHLEPTACQQTIRAQIHNERLNYADEENANGSRAKSLERGTMRSTARSSPNISVDDTVFSDSTNDLDKMERDYRNIVRSLQREYKSDGDTLDEVGKSQDEFQMWNYQSFEENFEKYDHQSTDALGQSVDFIDGMDETQSQERCESLGVILSPSADVTTNAECEGTPRTNLSGVCSPASHATYSTTNSSDTSCTKRIKEIANFFEPLADKENISRESDASTVTSPLKPTTAQSSSGSDPKRDEFILDSNATLNGSANAMLLNQPTDSDHERAPTARESTFFSLIEKPLGKLKKINKLLKSKRHSSTGLHENSNELIKARSVDNSTPPIPTTPIQSSANPVAHYREKSELTSKLFRARFSPAKSSNSDSKSSVYSSRQSLFSQIVNKSSIFHRKSPMFSNSSRSNNELNTRTTSRTGLSEMTQSNSEINKYRTSPMRFSIKRSMREKKPNSSTCVYSDSSRSQYTEQFYNTTGSVLLSQFELYHKFLSEDFVGLYKEEPDESPYAHGRNARLFKQRSEPKFTFRNKNGYDPREEDEDFYEEEFSDEYYDEYEDEECEFEDEEGMEEMEDMDEMEEMEEMDTEDEKDDDQRAYQSESDVDEILLMPDGGKCSDYEYEQYGFENKHFSLVTGLSIAEHDLGVIDEIPYLDDTQSQYTYITNQRPGCDEVLTILMSSSDDLLTVREDPYEEEEETILVTSQNLSISDHTEPGCSSVVGAINDYVKNVSSDISTNVESSDLKTVIERADSMELLSESSGTIRSGSTVTGYDFDTVKHLNFDSCSTSKLSLSLKSEGFDEFTLTPDEPKIIRNCDAEDFTLTPEASCNEIVCVRNEEPECILRPVETFTDQRAEMALSEMVRSESNTNTKKDDDSISSNEVVMIVDKFLAGERLLQQNLCIIPIEAKITSPLISPIDSDPSSTNALIEKQKSILFNLHNSSSKSTLDDGIHLDKLNFDDELENDFKQDKGIDTFTSEMDKELDLLFSGADNDVEKLNSDGKMTKLFDDNEHQNNVESISSALAKSSISIPSGIPTRYSMQKLEPYYFSDCDAANEPVKVVAEANKLAVATVNTFDSESSFLQRKILSKLKKNKSQSLGNFDYVHFCFE